MKRKKKFRWLVVILVLLLAAFSAYLNLVMAPVIKDLAKASVSNRASTIINDAIECQLEDGSVDYDSIIFLEKDIHGNITAIKTNIAQINRLKTQTLNLVDEMLLDLDISEIGLPIGSLILPELFSGTGPHLPVRIVSVSTSDAEFSNVFSEAGINQTAHQIMLEVNLSMTVLTPVGTQSVDTSSSVVVAETVIVGNVPNSYVNLG